ncbi:MAG TPA: NADH dehydrogenase ubiquinone Fe-S protein 4 [Sphingomonas sp.]|jgi:hypothetical protein|uniref:NADH dehydrogenase ubiquinone Fe-S protein 4 n=1 Tax=Sphingomonas sp. TaxID=28214 RepID=UPI002EDA59C7
MSVAIIQKRPQLGTEHGGSRVGQWQLSFDRAQPLRADPLTGWAGGGGDTRADQVRLTFNSPEEAIAYCERQGLQFEVVPDPPRRLQLQSYADNFK